MGKDVLDNFTEKQSEKIFKKIKKMMSANPNIMFVQKRMKPIHVVSWSQYGEQEPHDITGFEYIAIKRANEKEVNNTREKTKFIFNVD